MERMQITDDDWNTKRYCIRGKHVAIICAAVAAVGLAVGLGVGLTQPGPCPAVTPSATTAAPSKPPAQSTTAGTSTATAPPSATTPSVSTPVCQAKEDHSGNWKDFRLPDYIEPKHYTLEMRPLMAEQTYTGMVRIWLRLTKATGHVWLHLRETRLTEIPTLSQEQAGGVERPIRVTECFQYSKHEYVVVQAAEELAVTGDKHLYVLTLHFAGRLNGSLVGFYMTSYEEDGVTKFIAATDHEPTDARKSFPCFDEPNKKATYNISIIHEDSYQALSNMPVESTSVHEPGWNKTTFQQSVPMSTYLVCFAVHQFHPVPRISASGIPLTIYAQKRQIHTAEYAANVTKTIFDYYETYFNMPYSLPKLDKIAIPDFGTGAMENWGLITYRETNLLYDPEQSASINKQRVAAVIAHELVHQWFGNIVTMDWWDDLWLNEGFASYFEYKGVNATEPDWQMFDQVLIDDVLPVLKDDALQSSHPIVVNVSTPDEITSVFDGISYSKGASILRMLEDWITPQAFQTGCQEYLVKYQFKNARTDDFWASLEEASAQPVKEVMDTWTRQMGYPVLKVTSGKTVFQQRFLLDPEADPSQPPSELNYLWHIPMKYYATNKSEEVSQFYNKSVLAGVTLAGYDPMTDGFLKINPAHVGFFRVNYEEQSWDTLAGLLVDNHTIFSAADRAGTFDDAFAFARAELVSYPTALNLTKYLTQEEEYLPWHRVISALSYLTDMLEDDKELYPKFKIYLRNQVKLITDSLGWKDEGSHLDRLLRASILGLACKVEDPEALGNATEYFNKWLTGVSIPVNLRLLVYRYAMATSGNESSWNYMFQQFQSTPLAQEKDKLMYGLASVNNITLLDRYLSYLYNTSLIKSQDLFTVLQYISQNQYGKTMAFDWIRINWEFLVSRYTVSDRNLGRLVTRVTGTFNNELQLWQMKNFFAKYPNAGAGEMPRKQALETVTNNIKWLEQNNQEIKSWLDATVRATI
ncbi:glutamyl aminopeptidase [Ambystoma mexicanum]|uniref:glutamyl aminopeptidase n=1 Tax=Ambystoma mexicanum TaxID=8296 RepID=UPI0037E72F4E